MNNELKHISHSFRTDSYHLLEKVRICLAHSSLCERTSFQAKLAVDVYMAAECALKSLICSARHRESAAEVLGSIFACGHDLKCLLKKTSCQCLSDDEKNDLRALSKKGVSLRYNLDLFALTTSEIVERDDVKFQINRNYLDRLILIVDKLCSEAQKRHMETFPDSNVLMSRKQLEEQVALFRALSRKRHSKRIRCLKS